LIVAVLAGGVFAGPDVMAFWPEGDSPELVRAKKVLAALADEGECNVITSATNAASCRAALARLRSRFVVVCADGGAVLREVLAAPEGAKLVAQKVNKVVSTAALPELRVPVEVVEGGPAFAAFADETPGSPSAPATPVAPKPARRALPPEAFTTPTNFVALVNVNGAVDSGWLEEQAAAMQRSLMVGVKAIDKGFAAPEGAAADLRKQALGAMEILGSEAKIVVLLLDAPDLPPVLASPYENWVVMDAGWVKRGGGDAALVNDRMGKRIYQALGACCGAAYHPEREAVMRYSPTPEALDDCLSHNFHPLNSNAFSIVARALDLDPVRLRPRKELVEMGILQPRHAEPKEEKAEEKPRSDD
jgi:hypothetical protein